MAKSRASKPRSQRFHPPRRADWRLEKGDVFPYNLTKKPTVMAVKEKPSDATDEA